MASVVAELAPEGTAVARFDGSWFALRREIEAQLAGATPPNLLVYVSAPAPDPDPLEELRAVGASYRSLLPTVIRGALRGQLTDRRLEELGKQCQTLTEVEAALDAGASEADARLMALVSESNTAAIARSLLSGSYDEQLTDPSLLDAARTFFAQSLGAASTATEPVAMRADVYRHLVTTHRRGCNRLAARRARRHVHGAIGGSAKDRRRDLGRPASTPGRRRTRSPISLSKPIVTLHTSAVMTWQPGMETRGSHRRRRGGRAARSAAG